MRGSKLDDPETLRKARDVLRARNLKVRRPDLTFATMDHSTPTDTAQIFGGVPIRLESAAKQMVREAMSDISSGNSRSRGAPPAGSY